MTVDGRPRPVVDGSAVTARGTGTTRSGRHARPERRSEPATPPTGERPRHAVAEAVTEEFARVLPPAALPTVAPGTGRDAAWRTRDPRAAGPRTPPGGRSPVPAGPVPVAAATPEAAAKKPLYGFDELDPDAPVRDRVRVVLAERRSPTRAVRTVAEIEQQTETGEFLLVNLVRAQLALAVRLALVAVLVLGALPLLLVVVPTLSDTVVLGVRLPWLLLGLLPYPVLFGLGRLYTHHAERNERDFADDAED